jgi:hypothetical protein
MAQVSRSEFPTRDLWLAKEEIGISDRLAARQRIVPNPLGACPDVLPISRHHGLWKEEPKFPLKRMARLAVVPGALGSNGNSICC